MVSVFVIVKAHEIELKAAYTHISNSAQAKRATSADGNQVPTVQKSLQKNVVSVT